MRVIGQLGGTTRAAALTGSVMYAGAGNRVVAADVIDPRQPRKIAASVPFPGTVEGIATYGSLLVAAVSSGGLAILDPTAALELRSVLPLPGRAMDLAVAGSTAYIADGPGGLRIVDVADPDQPTEIATLLDLHLVMDVAISGERAFLAAADEGLIVVDVADPGQPVEVGRLFTGGYAFAVDAVEGTSLVALADGWGGLRVIDVPEGGEPALVASLPSSGWSMDVVVVGTEAYLADGWGLRLIDLSDPATPVEASAVEFRGGHAVGVAVDGALAAVVDDLAGVRTVALGDQPPRLQGLFAPLAPANGIAIEGDRAYLAAKGQGLRVVDISDPTQPIETQAVLTVDPVWGVAVAESHVLFSTFPHGESGSVGSLFGAVADTGQLSPGRARAGYLGIAHESHGSLTYLASELVVRVMDSSGDTPCVLGEIITKDFAGEGFEANGISVAGRYAYVADYYAGIHVIDVSDPRQPSLVKGGFFDEHLGVGKTFVSGGVLYALAATDTGPAVGVFGLDDPVRPALAGSVALPAETARGDEVGPQMALGAGYLLVADGDAGLVAIDVSDPTQPTVAGRLTLPGKAVSVAAAAGRAYVAADGGGLFVVEISAAAAAAEAARSSAVVGRTRTIQSPRSSCVVTTTADSGPGSLRACLASSLAGDITFDPAVFPMGAPATISPESGFSVHTDGSIDASGAGVVIDGRGELTVGFRLRDGAVLRGLAITGFSRAAVLIEGTGNSVESCVISDNGEAAIVIGGEGNRVVGSLIGLDRSGAELWGHQEIGIWVVGDRNVIGGPSPTDRNVISGNVIDVDIKGTADNLVQGNYVGTNSVGTRALGDSHDPRAFMIESGARRNRIVGNVIAGGVTVIDPGSSYNAIVGNRVGLGADGQRLAIGGAISIEEPFNRVGGTGVNEGNEIDGELVLGSDVIALGNRISGSVRLLGTRSVLGGMSPGAANEVAGLEVLVDIQSDDSVVIGNEVMLLRSSKEEHADAAAVRIRYGDANQIVANAITARAAAAIRLADGAIANVLRANVLSGEVVVEPGAADNLVIPP